MTSVLSQPHVMAATAADVAGIGSAIAEAKSAAAGSTTGLVAAAGDEVSEAAAALFNAYAGEYHSLIGQASVFHTEFAQTLAAAAEAYLGTEAGAAGALTAAAQTLWAQPGLRAAESVNLALVMGGSGNPTPNQSFALNNYNNFISRHFPLTSLPIFNTNLLPITTAEGLYPFTGTKDLTLDISVARGVTSLNNAILQAKPTGGNPLVVFGHSQSAVVSSLVMPQLLSEGFTSPSVNFVLTGDPMNPNGGALERFAGLQFPSLGLTFYGATPSNDFTTYIYSGEYDGFADFPKYPIDFLADLNALMGIIYVHPTYQYMTATQINGAIVLPQSGAPSMTTYYMIPTANLPLLDPLRAIPYIGNPLADALQGPLTPLINWGYGDPNYGWSTGPANVPTPFGFLPPLSDTTALGSALASSTQQGFSAAIGALHAEVPPSLPALSMPAVSMPALSLSSLTNALTAHPSAPGSLSLATLPSPAQLITNALLGLESVNNDFLGGVVTDVSTAYSVLLPTADIATAIAVSLPSYDADLFINGLIQAVNGQPLLGLANAFGDPIAADVGLVTLASGFELLAVTNALGTIVTGAPSPRP